MPADRYPLLVRAVSDARRGLLGWSVAVLAVTVFYLSTYPAVGAVDSDLLDTLPESMRAAFDLQDMSTGAGYAQSTVVGLVGLVLLTVASVSWAAKATAGDEEAGATELVLAHGVGRGTLVRQRAAAVAVQVLVLGALVGLGILAMNSPAGLGISPWHAIGGAACLASLALLHGSVALAVGAATGRRTYALVAGATVALLGYVANSVGASVPGLAWARTASPVHWAFGAQPLASGADWSRVVLLLAISGALVMLAVTGLRRRDIGL